MALNDLSGAQLLNTNGPVPTGARCPASVALPSASNIDGAGTMPSWLVSESGKVTHGVFMVMSQVSSPVALADSIGARAGRVSAEARWALNMVAMAAPVSGVPSWNLMLGRTVMVHTV